MYVCVCFYLKRSVSHHIFCFAALYDFIPCKTCWKLSYIDKYKFCWVHQVCLLLGKTLGECLASVFNVWKSQSKKWAKMQLLALKIGGWPCATEISMIVSMYVCPIALWTSLQLGNASTMKVNTDWKSQWIFIFMNLKGPLNWLKNKISMIEENLNKNVKHYLK